jgi:hypothetical protein
MLREVTMAWQLTKPRMKTKARMRYISIPAPGHLPTLNALQVEEFYSPGSMELLEARRKIAEYSLPRSDIFMI